MKKNQLIPYLFFSLLFMQCDRNNENEPLPKFNASFAPQINDTNYESAKVTITVAEVGKESLLSFGIIYSATETQPKVGKGTLVEYRQQANTTTALQTTKQFEMINLTPNTIYYVRPFATNANGTSYGEVFQVKTMAVTYKINIVLGSGIDDLGGGKVKAKFYYLNNTSIQEFNLEKYGKGKVSPIEFYLPGTEGARGEFNSIPNLRSTDLIGKV